MITVNIYFVNQRASFTFPSKNKAVKFIVSELDISTRLNRTLFDSAPPGMPSEVYGRLDLIPHFHGADYVTLV